MKLLIITWWVLWFIGNVKSKISGKKLSLRNNLNGGEMNNSKHLWSQITPGAQSALQDKSDFMNKIEANDLTLVSRHVLLKIKVIVE